jgi:hypothetical protein
MTAIVTRRRAVPGLGACVFGLMLLTSACAGDGSLSASSDDLFDSYDDDGDDTLGQAEWDQFHIDLDRDGNGVVSRDEFNTGLGGGDGRK